MLNLIKKSVPVGKVLTSPEFKIINFHSGSVRESPNVSQPETRPGSSQSRMPVLSPKWEEDIPECSGWEISRIFREKSDSQEMAFGNADLNLIVLLGIIIIWFEHF